MSDVVVSDQYLDRGIAHFKQNRFKEALMYFVEALSISPGATYALWNRATALLSMGDYARGFVEHEKAWELFKVVVGNRDLERLEELPRWRGERGARVLAYHEMGFGDAIMAFRFLPEVRRRADITLLTKWPLLRLAQQFGVRVVDKIMPDDLSGFDFRLQLFGVMSALRTTETFTNAPYIAANWRRTGNRVGIAWSGATQKDFTAQRFLSMLDHRGFKLYALQPGDAIGGVERLVSGCDFVDVADRIAQMDHVVTVDTSSAHLAAAMGHPSAHLLLPFTGDWRWWHTERWYPDLKTYRQHDAADWTGPFARVNAALKTREE